MARLILEISGPRLGSTNFRRVMERFDTVEALDEFFNPNQPLPTALLERVSRAAADRGHDVPVDRKRMTAFALEDPVRAVEIALDASASAGKTHPVLKLAPGHLSAHQIDRIVARFQPFGVILHRTPLDQFISREKALALKAWTSVDTTGIKPTISADAFRAWHWRQQNHLQMGRYLLGRHSRPIVVMRYEDLYAEGVDMAAFLRKRFAEVGLNLGPPSAEAEGLTRQDRSTDPRQKISNWEEFSEELARIDRTGRLERYSIEGVPLLLGVQVWTERLIPRTALRHIAGRLGVSGMPQRTATSSPAFPRKDI